MWHGWHCPHCLCGSCAQVQQCRAPRLGAARLQACRSALQGHSQGSPAEIEAGCGLRSERYLPAAEPAADVPSQEPGNSICAPVGYLRCVLGPVDVHSTDLDADVIAHCEFMAPKELQQCIWAACCHPLSCMDHTAKTSQQQSAAGSKESCKQHQAVAAVISTPKAHAPQAFASAEELLPASPADVCKRLLKDCRLTFTERRVELTSSL